MKKQNAIEKSAINFATQIFNLANSFPGDEKSLLGFEMTKEAVKICAGISTFFHLNEIDAAYNFLNNAFSATFRVEVYLLVAKHQHLAESIDEPMKSLENLQNRLDKMLNRVPDMI